MITFSTNNWFFSALVQANAALIGIISAFVINRVLNEYENIHSLDGEFNESFYKVRHLLNDMIDLETNHSGKSINLEEAKQIGSSTSVLEDWQEKSIKNYNDLVSLYLKEINRKERLSIVCNWMRCVYLLILVLVIVPACFIYPEGVQSVDITFTKTIILKTLFSLKSISLYVVYGMIIWGLSFIYRALNTTIASNKSRLKSIKLIFDNLCNEPSINSFLNSTIQN